MAERDRNTLEQFDTRFPLAIYRLQFNSEFTFRKAKELVDYLNTLGISDYYASPLLAARPGSVHGYDVIDPTKLNPELGTDVDLQSLSTALKSHGMGMILDVFPNHKHLSKINAVF